MHVVERMDSTNKQNAPTRVHMYTRTRTYINVYAYIYTDIHIYIYIHIRMHLYTHTCTHLYIRMHMHTYAQIEKLSNNVSTCQAISQTHIRIHIHMHAYTHIYTYTYVHNLQWVCLQMRTLVYQTHLCNIHTCPCTSAQNTCSKVHATLIAKNAHIYIPTHICIRIHMHTKTPCMHDTVHTLKHWYWDPQSIHKYAYTYTYTCV